MSRPLVQSEAFSLMEDFFRSGKRASEFYRTKNISEWQFYKWRRLYLNVQSAKVSSNHLAENTSLLQPVNIIGKPSCLTGQFEITYPCGVTLRVSDGTVDISLLRELVNL